MPFNLTSSTCFLLRSGCWRATSLRRLHASLKAPIWSPETKTSTSSDRYAALTRPLSGRLDVITMQLINGTWRKALISSWLIVFCGSWAGLEQRRGPSGAQRLQKETWLCSGYLWRLLRGTTTQCSTQWHFHAQQMMLSTSAKQALRE